MKQRQTKTERVAKANKGSTPTDGSFISFSDVISNPVEISAPVGAIPVYTGTDPALSVIAKKLSKKNSTTRLKALVELKEIVQVCCSNLLHLLILRKHLNESPLTLFLFLYLCMNECFSTMIEMSEKI
jgi:hypothetical protein